MEIEKLAEKVGLLIEQNRRLKADNEKYAIERERFIKEKQEQEKKIAELKDRLNAVELAGGLILSEKGVAPARKKLNRILREIDVILALTSETIDNKR